MIEGSKPAIKWTLWWLFSQIPDVILQIWEVFFFFVFSIHEIEEKNPQGEKHLNNPSHYDIYLN